MSRYRLTYFNGRGRCETIRLVFAAAGVGYEDRRLESSEWNAIKQRTPWGTLPMLEYEGNVIGQSSTIARFVAKEHGLGRNHYEQALIDSVVDVITELRERVVKLAFSPDGSEKENYFILSRIRRQSHAIRDFEDKICPTTFPNLDKFLARNPSNSGYFVGDRMTLADIHFYSTVENLLPNMPDALVRHPRLQELFDRVESNPRIAEYLRRRPVTTF